MAMKRRQVLLAVSLAMLVTALAFHCPADMKKIDQALAQNSSLSAEQQTEVKKLRVEGEQQYKAGEHTKSVDTLGKAMGILGMN
jgi:hypothetical protein